MHRIRRLSVVAAVALVAATALVACSEDLSGHVLPADASEPVGRPSSPASLTIRSPETGEASRAPRSTCA